MAGKNQAAHAGNPQFHIFNEISTMQVVEDDVQTILIPRGYDIESFGLHLSGSVSYTTAGAAVRAEAPAQLIKRVELIGDGKDTIKSVPGVFLSHVNPFRDSRPPITPPASAAIAANVPIDWMGNLDNIFPDGVRPKDTSLQSRKYNMLQLRITFGKATDLLTGAPVGSVDAGTTLKISAVQTVELSPAGQNEARAVRKDSYGAYPVTGANNNFQIPLPVGNMIRAVLIRTEDGGEPSNGVLNNAILQSGVDVRLNLAGKLIRNLNSQQYKVYGSGSGLPTGVYILDLCPHGRLTSAWDLRQKQQAYLTLDVNYLSASTQVYACAVEMIPPGA